MSSDNAYTPPSVVCSDAEKKAPNFTLVELLVVIAIIAILVALLLPASGSSSEARRRFTCRTNMRQVVLALRSYHDDHGCLPPRYVAAPDGTPLYSWRVLLLPYLENQPLYDKFHLDEPWDSPHNQALAPHIPFPYCCPNAERAADCETPFANYFLVLDASAIYDGVTKPCLDDVASPSGTMLIVEVCDERSCWTEPVDITANALFRRLTSTAQPRNHRGGIQVGLVDGSVIFLEESIGREDFDALVSRSADGFALE